MKLTLRQQEVLNLLIDYQRKHGFPPTTYELTGMLGCRSPNAAATHLKALERKGAITITRGVSRGISITPSVSRKELVVNLNSIVKVKLNEVSLSHLEKQHEENRIRYPGIPQPRCSVAAQASGYVKSSQVVKTRYPGRIRGFAPQHFTAHSPRIPTPRPFTKATSENAIAAWCARVWPFW